MYASPRPLVTNITAEIGSLGSIVLSWTMPAADDTGGADGTQGAIDEILVFSSPVPITSFEQIEAVSPKASLPPVAGYKDGGVSPAAGGGGVSPAAREGEAQSTQRQISSWVDKTPLKGDGFYAVVLVCDGKRFPLIVPSVNATVTGIQAAKKARKAKAAPAPAEEGYTAINGVRPIPLPSAKKPKKDMTDEAYTKAQSLTLQGKTAETGGVLFPYVFKEDIMAPQSGDEVFLFDILKSTFIKEKYTACAAELIRLLRTNMSSDVTMRSMFYLGECYYFTRQYGNAVTQFLKVKDYCALASLSDAEAGALGEESSSDGGEVLDVSSLCTSWIDSSLNLMSKRTSSL